ncbi:MAG: carbohydrate binding family 9 domain-containing protein [candidate division KSB1 bacterium]|nr:carbohydrate binding family 9 domain-containing protein [candidate division KSB1 bacterium]MDZ7274531.1 carbohydrate binding family 9 domain-containing protein [candidate division KSB1 bacterium]MDZ7284808.1 carbohydrate binding family 9 domain-containing protein [candidate division KSB1 bacterium]MDZ7297772.1 carbohydrate binding family 9 domain-containing protein [candidate division KSB1 bacterium]MDZ7306439.1 carbohydrate binding family 9 domain-containing protein [candidate division KSB1
MKTKIFISVMLLLAGETAAQSRGILPQIAAQRITTPITVDGRLREKAWQKSRRLHRFIQREPNNGKPASEKTEVAILHDGRMLYFGIWCHDRQPAQLTAQKMQRDFDYDVDDNFIVIIDTYDDDRNGYLFAVNPNGAMADARLSGNGKQANCDWDGVWQAEVQVGRAGWYAEIAIPFTTLKFDTSRSVWGVNFERNIRRKREQVVWQGWSADATIQQVARAGRLSNLKGLPATAAWQLRPYSLAGVEQIRGRERRTVLAMGSDLDYQFTPALHLSATLHPDFAQVESDRAQVNLTRFSLKFPEKRKFFLESREVFDGGWGGNIQPFYSRRIGLAEDGAPVPVVGGLRLLGKSGARTLGGMIVQTAARDTIAAANFAVLRWQQEVGRHSSLGTIATTRVQRDHFNGMLGGDYLFTTSEFMGNRNLQAGLAAAVTRAGNGADKFGSAQRMFLTYPNDLLELEVEWERAGTDFNPEVGFLRRKGYRLLSTEFEFNPRWQVPALPWLRQLEFKPLDMDYYRDDASGALQSLLLEFRPLGFSTRSRERFKFNVQRFAEQLPEAFTVVKDLAVPAGRYWFTRYEVEGETFPGRPLVARFTLDWGDFYNGRRTEWGGTLSWALNRFCNLSFDYQSNLITLPAGRFRLQEAGARADFAFNPRLFGAVFTQWNNDDEALLLNFRLQWLPRPGADFFFVVNHGVDTAPRVWQETNTTVLTKLVWYFAPPQTRQPEKQRTALAK